MIAPRWTAGWTAGAEEAAVFAAFGDVADVADFADVEVAFAGAFAADFVGFVAVDEPVPEPVAERGAGGIVARLLAGVHEHTFCR